MAEKVLMKGNEALAEAAIRAGCKMFFGYPITPQTELAAYMAKALPPIGGTYLQAESEVAAINMVYGASAAGVRVMTSSSSPGVSLKQEGISYMIGADLPALIINVQRGGPGLGSIQPSQADYWQATRATGHGDGQILVFAPSTVQEMTDLVSLAFDLGDKYRTPVMILADGLLGQMMEPVELPEEQPDAGAVAGAGAAAGASAVDGAGATGEKTSDSASDEAAASGATAGTAVTTTAAAEAAAAGKPWALTGHGGVRPKNIASSMHLDPQELEDSVLERYERYRIIRRDEQRADSYLTEDADITIVAYGAAARVARSAVNQVREEGIKAGLIRPISLWPFSADVIDAQVATSKHFLSVEFSMGQMIDDIRLVVDGRRPVHFFGHTGGIVPTPNEIAEVLRQIAQGQTVNRVASTSQLDA